MRIALLAVTAPLLGFGCAESEGCAPSASPSLTIGLGSRSYSEVEEGTQAVLVHGSQGGFHVDLAIEARGLDGSEAWAVALTGRVDGDPIGSGTPLVTPRCNGAQDAWQAWGLRLVWDSTPEALNGAVATVEATVTDPTGIEVSASLSDLTIEDPSL